MPHTAVTHEPLWTACRRTPAVRLREREHASLRRMAGKRGPAVAPWLSRDEEPIGSRVQTLNEAGLQGLERTPGPGRPTSLTPAPLALLKAAIRRCRREPGYHTRLWTPRRARHFIETRVGVEYCRARQRRHGVGFRLHRLRHRHLRAKAVQDVVCDVAGVTAHVRH